MRFVDTPARRLPGSASQMNLWLARYLWLWEGVLLGLAAPILLFPTLAPPLVYPALGLLLVGVGLRWRLNGRDVLAPPTPFSWPLVLWTVALLVGIAVSPAPALTLPKATNLALGLALWRYMVVYLSDRHRLGGLALYLLVGLGLAGVGVLSANWNFKFLWLRDTMRLLPSQVVQLPEAPANGVHANQLASVLILLLPVSLTTWLGWRPARGRLLAWLLGAVLTLSCLTVLVLTQSRSAWLATIVTCFVMGWAAAGRRLRWGLVIVGLAILGTAIGFARDLDESYWNEPATQAALGSFSPLGFRLEVWHWGVRAVEDFPLTGVGLGAFRQVAPAIYTTQIPPDYNFGHAHNIYLQVALDTGLPGLVGYLAWMGLAVAVGWRLTRADPERRFLALGFMGAVLALHIFGLTDAMAPGAKNGVLLWLALGNLAALQLGEKR